MTLPERLKKVIEKHRCNQVPPFCGNGIKDYQLKFYPCPDLLQALADSVEKLDREAVEKVFAKVWDEKYKYISWSEMRKEIADALCALSVQPRKEVSREALHKLLDKHHMKYNNRHDWKSALIEGILSLFSGKEAVKETWCEHWIWDATSKGWLHLEEKCYISPDGASYIRFCDRCAAPRPATS